MTSLARKEIIMDSLIENVKRIREEIAAAAAETGRASEEIKIVPATKTVSAERINLLKDIGIDTIGENRVQELLEKYDALDKSFHIHFIGKLQTNKVKYIIDKVDMIQSVDSIKLCTEISKRAKAIGRVMEVLVEVNIGHEETKSGVMPEMLVDFVREASKFDGLKIVGLMVIPPVFSTENQNAGIASQKVYNCEAYFKKVKELSLDILNENIDNVSMRELSMGMSSDYCEAVKCGATIVRPGRAIFGERNYKKI